MLAEIERDAAGSWDNQAPAAVAAARTWVEQVAMARPPWWTSGVPEAALGELSVQRQAVLSGALRDKAVLSLRSGVLTAMLAGGALELRPAGLLAAKP